MKFVQSVLQLLLAAASCNAFVTRSPSFASPTYRWQSAVAEAPLTRDGPHHPNIKSQYGVYETADGHHILFVTAKTNEAWDAFWIYMELPDVLLLDAWDNPGKRLGLAGAVDGVEHIRALMAKAFGSKTLADVEAFLLNAFSAGTSGNKSLNGQTE